MTGEELPRRPAHSDQQAGSDQEQTAGGGRIWPASSRFLRPWGTPGLKPKAADPWVHPGSQPAAEPPRQEQPRMQQPETERPTVQRRRGKPGTPATANGRVRAGNPVVEQRVLGQLVLLRNEVAGVDGSLVSTSDGLLVVQDLPNLEPSRTAALIATTLSIARQATQLTERGLLREAVIHGSSGYLAVFAVGDSAVLAVLGGENLNVGMLHYQTRAIVKRIEKDAGQFPRFASSLPEYDSGISD
jgi:uncharacterized protein